MRLMLNMYQLVACIVSVFHCFVTLGSRLTASTTDLYTLPSTMTVLYSLLCLHLPRLIRLEKARLVHVIHAEMHQSLAHVVLSQVAIFETSRHSFDNFLKKAFVQWNFLELRCFVVIPDAY